MWADWLHIIEQPIPLAGLALFVILLVAPRGSDEGFGRLRAVGFTLWLGALIGGLGFAYNKDRVALATPASGSWLPPSQPVGAFKFPDLDTSGKFTFSSNQAPGVSIGTVEPPSNN